MSPKLKKHLPILIILFISLVIGIFTFQDYGMTWDEYLYYQYGEAVGYAYSIPERLSGDFDINRAYGPSIGDHKVYGPVYLLLTRIPVLALRNITGLDIFSLWHLINFILFLVGIYFFYLLALRWLKPQSAFWASLLYLTQPLLWGHGFINPKDIPFASIFIITIYYGFRLVDNFTTENVHPKKIDSSQLKRILLVGILIGIATNLRIIAPFIAALIFFYALLQRKWRVTLWFIPIGAVAIATLYLTWPYLWDAPIQNFLDVLARMSNNPTKLKVLFYGNEYRAYELPLRYLPVLLGVTLTEPVWILFTLGFGSAIARIWKKELDWQSLGVTFFWFAFMAGYILTVRPPMYDGFRHFLFILPPIFILAGFGIEQILAWGKKPWLNTLVMLPLLFYGVRGIIALHPYEYAYYNQFVGGTSGAESRFETDYWLTCYKEAVQEFSTYTAGENAQLRVYREEQNAAYYLPENIEIWLEPTAFETGDYLLLSARLDEVNMIQRKSSNIIEIGRDGATFCAIREIAP